MSNKRVFRGQVIECNTRNPFGRRIRVIKAPAHIKSLHKDNAWLFRAASIYQNAWLAADLFIGSHVADPDLTDEMIENYREYLSAKKKLDEWIAAPGTFV